MVLYILSSTLQCTVQYINSEWQADRLSNCIPPPFFILWQKRCDFTWHLLKWYLSGRRAIPPSKKYPRHQLFWSKILLRWKYGRVCIGVSGSSHFSITSLPVFTCFHLAPPIYTVLHCRKDFFLSISLTGLSAIGGSSWSKDIMA